MPDAFVLAVAQPWCSLPPVIDANMYQEQIIGAVSFLLGEHQSVLQMAGQSVLRGAQDPLWATCALSVLLTAAQCKPGDPLSETEPHPHACDPHACDPQRIDRVTDKVAFLLKRDIFWLTESARQVLFDEPEIPGKLWIMQVLKTAVRVKDLRENRWERLLERWSVPPSFDAALPPPNVFSLLQGIDAAQEAWLHVCGGFAWPYEEPEAQYLLGLRDAHKECSTPFT